MTDTPLVERLRVENDELRKRWLRKELSEVHFTLAGRAFLTAPSASAQGG